MARLWVRQLRAINYDLFQYKLIVLTAVCNASKGTPTAHLLL